MINGTTTSHPATNPILTASSIDTSTSANAQHMILKTSASGGPPVSSMIASTSASSRTNAVDKLRSQTVRLPASGVRRRETMDPVPGGGGAGGMRKMDHSDRSKATAGET